MLEETGLPYEPHLVSFETNDQMSPEFLSLNPNNKIPAIIDPNGPGGKPLPLFESGAILIYLAEKTGQFMPAGCGRPLRDDPVGDVPDGRHRPDVRPARLLQQIRRQGLRGQAPARPLRGRVEASAGVLDKRLEGREWIMGDEYTIADIASFPWIETWSAFTRRASWSASKTSRTSRARSRRSLTKLSKNPTI
jgi:GST-like protein